MVFLRGLGIGGGYSNRVYRHFKAQNQDAIMAIRDNPYQLADIPGIGFKTADAAAVKIGVPPDSEFRKIAAVEHVVKTECANGGHILLPVSRVIELTRALVGVSDDLPDAIARLCLKDRLVMANLPEGTQCVAPVAYLRAEMGTASRLLRLAHGRGVADLTVADLIKRGQSFGLDLALTQAEALQTVLKHKLSVLTGGPGTGKTMVTRVLLAVAKEHGRQVVLCAPTGRAAKRLNESTGHEASTIHRLLGWDNTTNTFSHDEDEPLEGDLFLVDETSMVDVFMMNFLLKAIPEHAQVILVGDPDQLPSVSAGNVLHDIIASGVVPVARLTEIFRQGKGSGVSIAARAVINGAMPTAAPDFRLVRENSPPSADKIILAVGQLISEGYAPEDIQVLSPMLKGEIGVAMLNKRLQELLNPSDGGPVLKHFDGEFRVGDRVIQTRNNYTLEIFNGDIGYITAIDAEKGTLQVDFGDSNEGLVELDKDDLDDLRLAYALTIHKSQGGQFRAVVMPVSTQHYVMLNRNLVYTGITRAEKDVIIIGTSRAMGTAIRTDGSAKRVTLLAEYLRRGE